MKYTFRDILNAEIYHNTRVMFTFGKYDVFNNLVSDELKGTCKDESAFETTVSVVDDFGGETLDDEGFSNTVNFNTFMEVIGVSSINGKWFCKESLGSLTSKQKEKLMKYIKEPSDNGILVISSTDWMEYKDLLKNKILSYSKACNIMQLSFPSREELKAIVKQMFEDKGIDIQPAAVDFFIMKMSQAYNDYENTIEMIKVEHDEPVLDVKSLKIYMKGIENYIIDDFVKELTKPMSSDKTNSKKVLKVMSALIDEYTAKSLLYKVLSIVEQCIDFRLMINSGLIPIGINYFFNDIIKGLPEDSKYAKFSEWKFRKQAGLASQTSLKDWEYMSLMLRKAIENNKVSEDVMEKKCKRALYDICTRSVITADRINNIIGIDNVIIKPLDKINKIIYDEDKLAEIHKNLEMSCIE